MSMIVTCTATLPVQYRRAANEAEAEVIAREMFLAALPASERDAYADASLRDIEAYQRATRADWSVYTTTEAEALAALAEQTDDPAVIAAETARIRAAR